MYGCCLFRWAIALPLSAALMSAPARAAVMYVNKNAPGTIHDGKSWKTAWTTISGRLYGVAIGDEVWVAEGTYVTNGLTVPAGVGLFGGFNGSELSRDQRNPKAHITVLDGGQYSSTVTIDSPATSANVVDGFTIRNGCGNAVFVYSYTLPPCGRSIGSVSEYTHLGGGIYCPDGSPVISHNVIEDNRTDRRTTNIDPCSGGSSHYPGPGAGIYCSGSPTIDSNIVRRNIGGGGPLTPNGGGGICIVGPGGLIRNNLIYGNTSLVAGGGVYVAGVVTLANNTIANNFSADVGSGLFSFFAPLTQSNNIIALADQFCPSPQGPSSHNYTDQNPQFIDPASGDYHLKPSSPGVDAGDDTVVTTGETDLDGNTRKLGTHVDIGCYEFVPPPIYTLSDAALELRAAAGLAPLDHAGFAHLNVIVDDPSTDVVDILDAVGIARKAVGLDANP